MPAGNRLEPVVRRYVALDGCAESVYYKYNGRETELWCGRGWPIRALVLVVVLMVVGLIGLRVIVSWTTSEEPFVDLSLRAPVPRATPRRGAQTAGRSTPKAALQFAVATMVSAQRTFVSYQDLVRLVGEEMGLESHLVLRSSYAQVREALEAGTVDVAFVCTGTYVHARDRGRVELLAQPEFREGLSYRSLLLVPRGSSIQGPDDLRGVTMAFSDPESNTGCLVPQAELLRRGHQPTQFLGRIVFTGSHDRSVEAVASGMVDAAAIDALVFQSMLEGDPTLAERVRIAWQSEVFGPPPLVVPTALDPEFKRRLQQVILSLHQKPVARAVLGELGIVRFVKPREEEYESAYQLFTTVHSRLASEARPTRREP